MNGEEIKAFLRLIGAENIHEDSDGGWVRSSCPLARWTHEGGTDRKPSFGVKIPEEGEAPRYHCFTCQSSGYLPRLVSIISRYSGDRLLEASNYLSQFELFPDEESKPRGKRILVRSKFGDAPLNRALRKNIPVPAEVLEKYPLLAEKSELTAHSTVLRWLVNERKISLQSIANYKLRLFTNVLDDVGVLFPILAKDGETVLDMWARLIDSKTFFRITPQMAGTTVNYKAPNLLFGNHCFDQTKPGMIVEGGIDALRLYTLGVKNVVASFGSLSNDQLDSLYAPVLYLGFDNDEAGHNFTKKAVERLGSIPSISYLDWGVVGKKDAGELESVEQFKKVFEARTKILNSPKKPSRVVEKEKRPARIFLKNDGTFL